MKALTFTAFVLNLLVGGCFFFLAVRFFHEDYLLRNAEIDREEQQVILQAIKLHNH